MNIENTKNAMTIMQAHIDGKLIEHRRIDDPDEDWELDTNPIFDWSTYIYRVRPDTGKYRPFKNAKECLLEMSKHPNCGFVRNYEADDRFDRYDIIMSINDYGIYYCDEQIDFKDALTCCPFTDGTPFGIKIK